MKPWKRIEYYFTLKFKVHDIFGTGTALNIQPISTLGYKDKLYEVKINPKTNSGDLTDVFNQKLSAIQVFKSINNLDWF